MQPCTGSPTPWEDESFNAVTIPLGRSKNVVLVVRDGSQHNIGMWEVISDRRDEAGSPTNPTMTTIPYQFEGKLWVRLLSGGKVLQTVRFTWKRNHETGAFDIRLP